ncbi:MAG: PAS domain S-box protein [Bacteroidales bacterium]|nr:PAS domain S-box protein [Bacteroidales bacterium]
MISFDMRTIMISFLLTYLVSTVIIYILWIQYHTRYKGTTYLVLNFALQTLGLLLIVLRGKIPEWISVDLANTVMIAGILLGYMGLEAYTGKKSNQIHNYIILAIFAIVHTWLTLIDPDLTARNLNISVASLLIFLQGAWLMLYRVPRKEVSLTHPIGIIYAAFGLVSLANILKFLLGGKMMPADYFDAGSFDALMIIIYHMLVILLTFSLALMFSKNLLLDMKAEEEKSSRASLEKISEQNKYNEIIRVERNLLRALIDNIPDPISIKDRKGRYLLNNSAHLEVIGAENQEEAIGKTIYDFLPEGEAVASDDDDKLVLHTGKMMLDKVENRLNIETGFNHSLLTSRIPILDSEGVATQLVTISHNITDRKRAEDAHRESAEFNRSLLKTIPFGMDIVDSEGTILFQSDNFKKIFGSDAIGSKCWDIYRDDKKQCQDCPLTRGIVIGKTEKYESHGVNGGRIFDVYHTGMNYQGKKAMLEIFHDITERKIIEDELTQSKEKAEESDRLKTAFLHNVSHEIRTPMNAIVGFTTLLSEPDLSPENHRSYLEIITQSSNHLLSIVTDIIEVSNIEAGKLKLNMNKVVVHSVMEKLHKQFSLSATSKGLDLFYEQPEHDPDRHFYTDSTKLFQVLSNLLANACKFTREGFVKMGYTFQPDYIQFYVSDTGIGISEDQQTKIFERFYQVDSGEDRQYEGTGLGLSLSKAYIEFLGGKLWVESEAGKGSTFFLNLPC